MIPGPQSSPSIPPRGITWPMVAYALVRELPSTASIVSGCVVAVVLIARSPTAMLEPIAALVVPAIISALARSRPAESLDVRSAGQSQ